MSLQFKDHTGRPMSVSPQLYALLMSHLRRTGYAPIEGTTSIHQLPRTDDRPELLLLLLGLQTLPNGPAGPSHFSHFVENPATFTIDEITPMTAGNTSVSSLSDVNTFIRQRVRDEITRARTGSRRFPNGDGDEDGTRGEEEMAGGRSRADAKRKRAIWDEDGEGDPKDEASESAEGGKDGEK